ncbi:MAG TPA: cation:proton antiporter [Clostridia bacterium]|nr:cation:proton antiporter [Clostridia bacterium]
MTPEPRFFVDFAYVFVAALAGGLLARRLRQPLILGYVFGGILIGRFTPGPAISDLHFLEMLAEVGVILLMYSIGIEFSARDLLRVKWVALLGGFLGILLSIALGLAVGHLLGWTTAQGITIGAVISVASTMVLSRLLIDRGELHSRHGSVMIGITLVEDMAVVVMTVLLPSLSSIQNGNFLAIGIAFGKSALLLIPIGFIAYKLVPPIMTRVARTRSQELYLLVALALGFATAAVTQAVGFSLALGAFLAGMVISESEYAHQTLAQLLPLRDAFVALFFVTIGALIDPSTLFSNLPLLATLVALVIFGKFVVWGTVVLLFGYGVWTAILVAVGLTQIGEFSFILVQVARNAKLVGDDVYNATLATALVTILLNALLMRFVPAIIGRYRFAAEHNALGGATVEKLHDHVVLCGFGRVGSVVGTALETFGTPYVVVEIDPDIVKTLRSRGVPAIFGDPVHVNILEEANVADAALVVITLPQLDRALLAAEIARRLNPTVPIIARAHGKQDRDALIGIGATEIVQPEAEASLALIRRALDYLKVPGSKAAAYLSEFRSAVELAHYEPRETLAGLPQVREILITPGMATGESIGQQHVRERFGITILTITKEQDTVMNPPATARFEVGDRLRVFGLAEQIDSFDKSLRTPIRAEEAKQG